MYRPLLTPHVAAAMAHHPHHLPPALSVFPTSHANKDLHHPLMLERRPTQPPLFPYQPYWYCYPQQQLQHHPHPDPPLPLQRPHHPTPALPSAHVPEQTPDGYPRTAGCAHRDNQHVGPLYGRGGGRACHPADRDDASDASATAAAAAVRRSATAPNFPDAPGPVRPATHADPHAAAVTAAAAALASLRPAPRPPWKRSGSADLRRPALHDRDDRGPGMLSMALDRDAGVAAGLRPADDWTSKYVTTAGGAFLPSPSLSTSSDASADSQWSSHLTTVAAAVQRDAAARTAHAPDVPQGRDVSYRTPQSNEPPEHRPPIHAGYGGPVPVAAVVQHDWSATAQRGVYAATTAAGPSPYQRSVRHSSRLHALRHHPYLVQRASSAEPHVVRSSFYDIPETTYPAYASSQPVYARSADAFTASMCDPAAMTRDETPYYDSGPYSYSQPVYSSVPASLDWSDPSAASSSSSSHWFYPTSTAPVSAGHVHVAAPVQHHQAYRYDEAMDYMDEGYPTALTTALQGRDSYAYPEAVVQVFPEPEFPAVLDPGTVPLEMPMTDLEHVPPSLYQSLRSVCLCKRAHPADAPTGTPPKQVGGLCAADPPAALHALSSAPALSPILHRTPAAFVDAQQGKDITLALDLLEQHILPEGEDADDAQPVYPTYVLHNLLVKERARHTSDDYMVDMTDKPARWKTRRDLVLYIYHVRASPACAAR